MIELPLHDPDGRAVGRVCVDETVLGPRVRRRLLHQVVSLYQMRRYKRTAHTKHRGEVAGAGRKPWPQKHTGRARAGSIRSPLWKGGGTIFGPRRRSPRFALPRRMRREALRSALLGKLQDKEVYVIQNFNVEKPSTRRLAQTLRTIGLDRGVLIGVPKAHRELYLSARNIPRVDVSPVGDWNAYEVLRHRALLVTPEALERLGPAGGRWILPAHEAREREAS
jgi:large subunit ribosomal protein L4